VTLLALLRAAAFGWQQYHIAENARLIADQGRELYTRFLNVIKPIADAGDKLGKSVDAYNKAIGSMETRLMPALRNLKAAVVASEEPPLLEPLEQNPRLPLDVEA
jgi:DNA recombination protein RmuC